MQNKFFGSKLNAALLLILIILMVIAIGIMIKNRGRCLETSRSNQAQTNQTPQISGNKDDLVYFSILPNSKVRAAVSYRGVVKGGYFFEGNILINVLDANKKLLKAGHGTATDEWMTSDPVSFEGNIDFSGLPKGPAYIEIHNDNPSDDRGFDKSILIPIVIE